MKLCIMRTLGPVAGARHPRFLLGRFDTMTATGLVLDLRNGLPETEGGKPEGRTMVFLLTNRKAILQALWRYT